MELDGTVDLKPPPIAAHLEVMLAFPSSTFLGPRNNRKWAHLVLWTVYHVAGVRYGRALRVRPELHGLMGNIA